MKKKLTALVIALLILFSFAACSSVTEKIVKVELTEEETADLQKFVEERKYIDQIGKDFVSAELSNQEILNLICDEYLGAYSGFKGMEFSFISNMAEKHYGVTVTPENVVCRECGEVRAVYDSADGFISIPDSHTHDFRGDISESLIEFAEMYKNEAGDEYTVLVYKIFSDLYKNTSLDVEGFTFYPSYNDAVSQENSVFYAKTDVEMQEKYAALEDADKTAYIYIFSTNDAGEYVLKSYKKFK